MAGIVHDGIGVGGQEKQSRGERVVQNVHVGLYGARVDVERHQVATGQGSATRTKRGAQAPSGGQFRGPGPRQTPQSHVHF